MEVDPNMPLWQLTVGQFLELVEQINKPAIVVDTTTGAKRYVYHLSGIAELFGCSKTTANRIKQSGKIDEAITQVGNLIVTDAEKALELAGRNREKK